MGENISKFVRIFVLISILIVSTAAGGCLKSFDKESQLRVTNIDITAERVESDFVDMSITTYLENYGSGTSKNTTILLKAYSTETGLLEVQNVEDIGVIEKSKTENITQSLRLPKTGGYRIVAEIFEDNIRKSNREIVIYNLENLKPDVQDIGIGFSDIDFIVKNVNDGSVIIQNDIYLTYEGTGQSDDYDMLVKAREIDSSLIADKAWTNTGKIDSKTTIIKSVNITVPDNYNYVVELIIWNNDTIVKRGEDYLQLNPTVEIQKGATIETKDLRASEFVSEEMEYESEDIGVFEEIEEGPGFGIVLAMASIIISAILRRKVI